MTFDEENARPLTPEDDLLPLRVHRWRQLGLTTTPVPEFDQFARELAASHRMPFAMINLVGDLQYFTGLHIAPGVPVATLPPPPAGIADPTRVMNRDTGVCPHVVKRGLATPVRDVHGWFQFAGNPVIDMLGVRTYLGAPMVDDDGLILGTICVVGQEPRSWTDADVHRIKQQAKEAVRLIHRRARDQT